MTLFILTLFQTGYKLRISTLYHLLVGKRTSSVLLHGFFYKNLAYLGTMPTLKEETFQRVLQQLRADQLITTEDGLGELTQRGKKLLAENSFDLSGLDSLRYGRMRENSWQLLLFGVQVVSHLSFNEKNYLPIENRPYYLQQIKKWLAQSQPGLVARVQQELTEIFQGISPEIADFLANQISGHDFQGKTAFQLLPEKWQEAPWDTLYQQRAIDLFLAQAKTVELSRLLAELDQQNSNQSMLKTRAFFLAGKTASEILTLRRLKQGTINDHFIEWALLAADFPFERFEHLSFENLTENQIIDARYQDYEVSYLNFRLSQIYYLREQPWT
ncbi:helix-turn-helix domain-containing protein [Enterococcus pingfangensis]|uniref:helix-turn-helix domain-containing protein n=1 Tax=Enterococcus pingfangensis TaxID=2559924 RepID=UPI0010F78B08|nr:helix-turn-helix domain-containing protein [Enterococcus pingfangensis]